ncbi:MAG: hypothetical protein FJ359_02770 [Thaumarchaeota archaeon]|nr:hypothetical protein [Nitrososphaerota archaeon]
MGFFKRLKKHEEPEDVLIKKETDDGTIVKSHDGVLKERSQGESDYLRKEIQTNTAHLNSVLQKLADVKEEYDQVVGNLMSTKREMKQKKMELETIKKEYAELQNRLSSAKSEHNIAKSTLDELNEANLKLASIKSQIAQHKEDLEKIRSQPPESQVELEQVKTELAKAKSEVDLARQQLQYLKDESDNKRQEIEVAKKELKLLESDLSSTGRGGASKNVIEAASAVVAATNAKLQKAQQEIEVLKQAIERERTEHIKTKKQLGELQKSKKQKS